MREDISLEYLAMIRPEKYDTGCPLDKLWIYPVYLLLVTKDNKIDLDSSRVAEGQRPNDAWQPPTMVRERCKLRWQFCHKMREPCRVASAATCASLTCWLRVFL